MKVKQLTCLKWEVIKKLYLAGKQEVNKVIFNLYFY